LFVIFDFIMRNW